VLRFAAGAARPLRSAIVRRYRRGMRVTFEWDEDSGSPWGCRQPRFEALACDGESRFFLVYRGESGEQVRVELAPARYHGQVGE
jgi:hypothetical protein